MVQESKSKTLVSLRQVEGEPDPTSCLSPSMEVGASTFSQDRRQKKRRSLSEERPPSTGGFILMTSLEWAIIGLEVLFVKLKQSASLFV